MTANDYPGQTARALWLKRRSIMGLSWYSRVWPNGAGRGGCWVNAVHANPAVKAFHSAIWFVSFSPPITPPISGRQVQTSIYKPTALAWFRNAVKPQEALIPSGTGWVKQTSPGTFASFPACPEEEG